MPSWGCDSLAAMDIRLFVIVVLFVTGVLLVWSRRRTRLRTQRQLPPVHRWRHRVAIREGDYPYYARKNLLTRSELRFHQALAGAVDERFVIAMSVRLADVINCSRDAWTAGHGALISSKQLDFVLCEPHTTRIVLAIELDDPTHGLADRVERDEFLDNAMRAAGVPLLRVPTAKAYDVDTLRAAIDQTLSNRKTRNRAA